MKSIYFSFLLLFGGILLMNHSGGRSASQGQGNTGAPGDNSKVCKNCHNSASIATTLEINLLDINNNKVNKYKPEETYTVQVNMIPIKGSPKAFGFQMVCLDAELNENGADLKNWIDGNKSNNYKISEADNGRSYVEHDRPSQAKDFKVKWKAPKKGTGTVSFYSAGNAVNLNGATSGDGSTKNAASFEEDESTSITKNFLDQTKVYPSHFIDFITIELPTNEAVHTDIINNNGNVVATLNFQNKATWNLAHLSSGMYHLKISSNNSNNNTVRKLIKL